MTRGADTLHSSGGNDGLRNPSTLAADSSTRRCSAARSLSVTVKTIGQIRRFAATSRSARPLTVT